VEVNKGLLPGVVSVRMLGGHIGNLHSRVEGSGRRQMAARADCGRTLTSCGP
jgi:hypothetical protein